VASFGNALLSAGEGSLSDKNGNEKFAILDSKYQYTRYAKASNIKEAKTG
jgi:hypothetical protein